MAKIILLDAGPLGRLVYASKNRGVQEWLADHLDAGTVFILPEIADYEVRRMLLRRRAPARLRDLDAYVDALPMSNGSLSLINLTCPLLGASADNRMKSTPMRSTIPADRARPVPTIRSTQFSRCRFAAP